MSDRAALLYWFPNKM